MADMKERPLHISYKDRCWSFHPDHRRKHCSLPKHSEGEHRCGKLIWPIGPNERQFFRERQQIERFGVYPRCFYCAVRTTKPLPQPSGVRVTQPPATVTEDHYVPRSRGGAVGTGNKVHACLACNSTKGNRMPDEWYVTGRYEGANRG